MNVPELEPPPGACDCHWPHLLVREREAPDDAALLDLMLDWAPSAAVRNRILADNPAQLYGFPAPVPHRAVEVAR